MTAYPKWWDRKITVFNRYEDPQTKVVTWYKTELAHCFWKNNFQRLKLGDVEVQTDSIVCRIPYNKSFLEKTIWVTKPNDVKGDYFTLAQGDIIIVGSVSDTINEYQEGYRSSDIVEKYKGSGSMVIDRVNINTYTGVGVPHYHVEGV